MSRKILEEKSLQQLVLELPNILTAPGQMIRIGFTSKETPYIIARVTIGKTDYWILTIEDEDSSAFMMACSTTTEGYINDLKAFLFRNWCITWNDPVWQQITKR